MKLRDLIVDHKTGLIRESKVWSNIGKAAMTWGFCYTILRGGNSEWLWIAYGTVVVGHEAVTRMLNQKDDKNANGTV